MKRLAAFLRGMNVGGHRVTNDELCGIAADLGLENAAGFLASGNLVFEVPRGTIAQLTTRLEKGLRGALGYGVPVVLRTAEEVRRIAAADPFPEKPAGFHGKLQVMLLAQEPSGPAKRRVLGLATADDLLAFGARELFWLPRGGLLESNLDLRAIERALGKMTTRTWNTVARLAAKHFEP